MLPGEEEEGEGWCDWSHLSPSLFFTSLVAPFPSVPPSSSPSLLLPPPKGKKYHYIISRHPDGSVAIQDGTKFSSTVELIQYHTRKVDGLLTTLTTPCCRRPGQSPRGYRFVSHEEMQTAMREAALQLGYQVGEAQSLSYSILMELQHTIGKCSTVPETTVHLVY